MNRDYFTRPIQGGGRGSWDYGNTRLHRKVARWHRPANEPSLLAGAGILVAFAVVFGLLAVAWSGGFV